MFDGIVVQGPILEAGASRTAGKHGQPRAAGELTQKQSSKPKYVSICSTEPVVADSVCSSLLAVRLTGKHDNIMSLVLLPVRIDFVGSALEA